MDVNMASIVKGLGAVSPAEVYILQWFIINEPQTYEGDRPACG
jgi:hypothetical protein